MQSFTFYNPVKILFGRGQIATLANELPTNARICLTYGGGSIKTNGVYNQVMNALAGFHVMECGGIEPNPSYETLMPLVEQVRNDASDFLLAVGGGSVIDGTKFIAAAVHFDGDPWQMLSNNMAPRSALPIGTVLTLPAAGSEMNANAVISRQSTHEKKAFSSPLVFPRFSVLDPETTVSLPARHIANGIIDAFVHVVEQYITYPDDAPLQDRMAESILLTLIDIAADTLQHPTNYHARATLMWCATMALNGMVGVGVPQDWSTHMIGHELTALHGIDHGQTLAIVLPSSWHVRRQAKYDKLLQYAKRVWGITNGTNDERVDAAIAKTRAFFESLGVSTHLSSYGVTVETINVIEERLKQSGVQAGEHGDVTSALVREILCASL